jgi:5-methylcytosine-specific restriction endonuclease McrA
MKRCCRCGVVKALLDFGTESRAKDGLRSACKPCLAAPERIRNELKRAEKSEYDKAYRAANAEKIKVRKAEWAQANAELLKAKREAQKDHRSLLFKNWVERNKDRLVAKRKSQYHRDPAAARAKAAAYRAQHPDRIAAYKSANKDKIKAYWHKRRARQFAGGAHTPDDINRIRRLQKNKCAACAERLSKTHIDHVMPLAKGGSNDPSNIQLLCPTCNLRKGAKHPVDFMQQLGRLL